MLCRSPVLLVDRRVPFDLRHRRVLLYDYSARGCKRLEEALRTTYTQVLPNQHRERPNQTLLVIGQLVVGLLLGGVAVSERGILGVTEPCGGLLCLGGVTFCKSYGQQPVSPRFRRL